MSRAHQTWRGWAIVRNDRPVAGTLASDEDTAWRLCQVKSRSEARRWSDELARSHFLGLGYRSVRVEAGRRG